MFIVEDKINGIWQVCKKTMILSDAEKCVEKTRKVHPNVEVRLTETQTPIGEE